MSLIKPLRGSGLGNFTPVRAIYRYLYRTLLTEQNRYVKKEILGSEMYLDLRDEGISLDLFNDGIREPLMTEAIQKEIKSGDIVIDIGANIGYYALLEAKLVREEGMVYAIEPVPQNAESLRKNIKLNGYSNIEVFQIAIGGENKTDFIYVSNMRNMCSMIYHEDRSYNYIGKTPVTVITLDNFLEDKPYPDLIRMDVEGYEIEIIRGMKKLLQSNKPLKLAVELHFVFLKEEAKDFLNTLKNFGFRVKIATIEPLACIGNRKFAGKLINILSKRTDAKFGYLNVTMDDLLNDELLMKGEVEGVEILFERN